MQVLNLFRSKLKNWLTAFGLLVTAVGLGGCGAEVDPNLTTLDLNQLSSKSSDITRTMGFVFGDRQFQNQEIEEKVSLGLNRWAKYSGDVASDVTHEQSDAIDQLRSDFPNAAAKRPGEMVFIATDTYFLQESVWISKVAQRVCDAEFLNLLEFYRLAADDFKPEIGEKQPVTVLMKKLHPSLDDEQAKSLGNALKLFDWVVRNIHLLPEENPTEDDIAQQRLNDSEGIAAAGVRQTGSQRHPYQSMIFSRGDYVDRAKLFLLLAREAGLNAAMLLVPDGQQSRPWAVAVAIGGEYYLFDTKLGMPIPGKELGKIATLSEVRSDEKLLNSLDLSLEESLADDTKYWVKQSQLEKVEAKIYVTPESVSLRMAALEAGLVGDQRLSLSVRPSKQLANLPAAEGLEKSIWDIAFQTHQFRDAVREAIPRAVSDDQLNDRLRWYFTDEYYIDAFRIYRTCRARFFKGKFESKEEDLVRNAVESNRVLMYSDDAIDQLGTNSNTMKMVGLDETPGSAEFENKLRSIQGQMRLVRRDVGLFLAQCLFDNGNPGTSANWLQSLAIKGDVARWESSVKYLLGRSFESRKEYDRAIAEYQFEDSAQVHGNLIRVRLLKQMIAKVYPEVAANN